MNTIICYIFTTLLLLYMKNLPCNQKNQSISIASRNVSVLPSVFATAPIKLRREQKTPTLSLKYMTQHFPFLLQYI